MKFCRGCERDLPLTEFGPCKRRGKVSVMSRCRACTTAAANLYYKTNKAYARSQRDQHFVRKYGITVDQRDAMIEKQDGRCAICGSTEGSNQWGSLVIDHDHESGTLRGMLCDHCNRGLGHFRDDVDLLIAAAAYLMQTTNVLT